jgi:hypothetical protein
VALFRSYALGDITEGQSARRAGERRCQNPPASHIERNPADGSDGTRRIATAGYVATNLTPSLAWPKHNTRT